MRLLPNKKSLEIGHRGTIPAPAHSSLAILTQREPESRDTALKRRCSYLAPVTYVPLTPLTRVFLGCSYQFQLRVPRYFSFPNVSSPCASTPT